MRAIALHTPADRGALFTRLADDVVETPSYLDAPAIVAAAKAAGAQCLHPGYGFLSENADFAEYCALEGVAFVGPASAVEAMLAELRKGPPYGWVESVEIVARGAAAESGFVIASTL